MRNEIIRNLKNRPFQAFAIVTDSGERIAIHHPENVAYDPEYETRCLYAISGGVLHTIPWNKISSLGRVDTGEPLESDGKRLRESQ